jgi:hypothetical protein
MRRAVDRLQRKQVPRHAAARTVARHEQSLDERRVGH